MHPQIVYGVSLFCMLDIINAARARVLLFRNLFHGATLPFEVTKIWVCALFTAQGASLVFSSAVSTVMCGVQAVCHATVSGALLAYQMACGSGQTNGHL
jgi:hypothetical protein